MKVTKKDEIKTYSYTVRNPSPLSRKQKALSLIQKKMDGRTPATMRSVSFQLKISMTDASNTVKELANAGYVQIGKPLKKMGPYRSGSNRLSITPGKDVTNFLKLSEDENAETSGDSDSE